MVGHTVGFDLAVLKRECELAGLPWIRPRTLDTRLLAQIAAPELAGYSLEQLAAWLGIDAADRHSALGDALTTARVFLALVPKLRDHGIRTIAEAERACLALTAVLDDQARAGWIEAVEAPARADAERTLKRFDSYAYRHRSRDIMRIPRSSWNPTRRSTTSLRDWRARKYRRHMYGRHTAPAASRRRRPASSPSATCCACSPEFGAAALDLQIEKIMSQPLAAVPADAFVYRAIGRMNRLRTRHLGVVDDPGGVVGALSARDLLRLRAGEAISLGDEIDDAADAHALGARLGEAAAGRGIAAGGGPARPRHCGGDFARARRAHPASHRDRRGRPCAKRGQGEPPCRYAMTVLGSAGRGESLLAMDQDNAADFRTGEPEASEDRWFAALGAHVADILHEVGVPYCKGGVMARVHFGAARSRPGASRIDHWVTRSDPEDLLAVDIFFDMLAVHGDAGSPSPCGRLLSTLPRGGRVRQASRRGSASRRARLSSAASAPKMAASI